MLLQREDQETLNSDTPLLAQKGKRASTKRGRATDKNNVRIGFVVAHAQSARRALVIAEEEGEVAEKTQYSLNFEVAREMQTEGTPSSPSARVIVTPSALMTLVITPVTRGRRIDLADRAHHIRAWHVRRLLPRRVHR